MVRTKPQLTSATAITRFKSGAFWLFTIMLIIGIPATLVQASAGPEWKIDRAVVHTQKNDAGQQQFKLMFSLRNNGNPGETSVTVLGRWVIAGNSDVVTADASEVKRFVKIGRYQHEVALKKSAIITVSLRPLGPAPKNSSALELAVLTGKKHTDSHTVSIPRL